MNNLLFRKSQPAWLYGAFVIGFATLLVRILLDSSFSNTALVYVGVPFLLGFFLFQFTQQPEKTSPWLTYLRGLRNGTIIMLATSLFLFEGFICVLMFMPIYYGVITLVFLVRMAAHYLSDRGDRRLSVNVLPVLISILSLEGVTPATTFERENSVTRIIATDLSIDELKENMALPIDLPNARHGFLTLFPLPVDVQAGTLAPGDVHRLRFIYKKWFFTNIHEGEFHLRIDSVSDSLITTTVVHNDSYLASYLDISGTEVRFKEISNGQTQVSLTINYSRLLDPIWYFGPLQRSAVSLSADYLMNAVILRSHAA